MQPLLARPPDELWVDCNFTNFIEAGATFETLARMWWFRRVVLTISKSGCIQRCHSRNPVGQGFLMAGMGGKQTSPST